MSENLNPLAMLLNLLFERLKQEGIFFVLLRNYEELPEKVDNDIDVWVQEKDASKFYELLYECSILAGWNRVSHIPRFGYKTDTFFYFEKPFNTLHIDCWHKIMWRNIKIADDSVFRKHIQKWHNKFLILTPGTEAAILLMVNVFYQRKMKEKYNSRILECCKKDKTGFIDALKVPFGTKLAYEIFSAAISGNWIWLKRKRRYMIFILTFRAILRQPLSQIRQWFIYAGSFFYQYLSPRMGLFVVLIGPDGSGKTTTANAILKSDIKRFFIRSSYYHGHFKFLPELSKLFPFKKKWNHHENVPSFNPPMHPLRATIYPVYYGINFFFGHLKVWQERARGGLIVFDRYFYDYLLQRQYSRCHRWAIHFIMKIIPKPDVIVYLKCAPEVINARKPELSVEEIRQQQMVCDFLSQSLPNVSIVQTTTFPEETLETVQLIISNRLKSRHG